MRVVVRVVVRGLAGVDVGAGVRVVVGVSQASTWQKLWCGIFSSTTLSNF